jgi:hypothetical protein
MANNTITFNPDGNAEAYGVNLVISTRSDFTSTFKVLRPDKSNFDFTSYTGSSQMAKSVSIGSSMGDAGKFTVGFTSATSGEFKLTMPKGKTGNLKPGRYVWDILVSSGSTVYRLAEGNVTVISGISSSL